jgi:hypothetical protein
MYNMHTIKSVVFQKGVGKAQCFTVKAGQGENAAKGHLKVSRQDILHGSHNAARLKELESWHKLCVLGPAIRNYNGHSLQCIFLDTWKMKNGERVAKSRHIALGDRDRRDTQHLSSYSGTCWPDQDRVCTIFGLGEKWEIGIADVPTAFIRADASQNQPVVLRLPFELPPGAEKLGYFPGAYHRHLKAVYGTKEAAQLFQNLLKQQLGSNQWKEIGESLFLRGVSPVSPHVSVSPATAYSLSKHTSFVSKNGTLYTPHMSPGVSSHVSPQTSMSPGVSSPVSIYKKPTGQLSAHVDDLKAMANDVASVLLKETGDKLGITDVTVLKIGDKAQYIGTEWYRKSNIEVLVGQPEYALNIETGLSVKEASRKIAPHDFKQQEVIEIDMSLQKEHQALVGKLGWLAKTQFHLAFSMSAISSFNHRPTKHSLALVKRLCEYAKRTHTHLRFVGNVKSPCLLGWCDGS